MKKSDFSVNGIKTFIGHEGHGFNANLLYKGKKIALVRDMASGGDYEYDWLDYKAERVNITGRNFSGKPYSITGTPNEKLFTEHVANLSQSEDDKKNGWFPYVDTFVSDLVGEHETNKAFKRKCKTHTLYTTTENKVGEYYLIKRLYTPMVKRMIEVQNGNKLTEIINERFTV